MHCPVQARGRRPQVASQAQFEGQSCAVSVPLTSALKAPSCPRCLSSMNPFPQPHTHPTDTLTGHHDGGVHNVAHKVVQRLVVGERLVTAVVAHHKQRPEHGALRQGQVGQGRRSGIAQPAACKPKRAACNAMLACLSSARTSPALNGRSPGQTSTGARPGGCRCSRQQWPARPRRPHPGPGGLHRVEGQVGQGGCSERVGRVEEPALEAWLRSPAPPSFVWHSSLRTHQPSGRCPSQSTRWGWRCAGLAG